MAAVERLSLIHWSFGILEFLGFGVSILVEDLRLLAEHRSLN